MDENILKGDWKIVKGKVKETWGDLTDDDITKIDGKKDQLMGTLQKKYGYQKDEAERRLNEFEKKHCK